MTRAALAILLGLSTAFATQATAEENASNPLAATNNVDLRYQFTGSSDLDTHDLSIDGAHMILPTLKFKYELHYNHLDGNLGSTSEFDRLVLKPIWFPYQAPVGGNWGMKAALGLELLIDLSGNEQSVIAGGGDEQDGFDPPGGEPSGVNQLAPFAGLAFANSDIGLTLVPLVQHYTDIGPGRDVSQTAFRLIAIQPFAESWWLKLDAKAPFDWENEKIPATAELQLGHNLSDRWAAYVDVLAGIGNDRPYDAGVGVGLRLKY